MAFFYRNCPIHALAPTQTQEIKVRPQVRHEGPDPERQLL